MSPPAKGFTTEDTEDHRGKFLRKRPCDLCVLCGKDLAFDFASHLPLFTPLSTIVITPQP
jgi:hypothetical protein